MEIIKSIQKRGVEIYSANRSAVFKCRVSDGGDALWDGDAGETRAPLERTLADGGDTVTNCYVCQVRAIFKRRRSNRGHTIGDGDVGETRAPLERTLADGGDTVGDGDTREAAAILERIGTDRGQLAVFTKCNRLLFYYIRI